MDLKPLDQEGIWRQVQKLLRAGAADDGRNPSL